MKRVLGPEREKGLQSCSLVIGARDDSFTGDPCYRSVRVRGRAGDPSLWPGWVDDRCGVDGVVGRSGSDGYPVRPSVPRADREAVAGLVSAPARPVPVQSSLAAVDAVARACPVAA